MLQQSWIHGLFFQSKAAQGNPAAEPSWLIAQFRTQYNRLTVRLMWTPCPAVNQLMASYSSVTSASFPSGAYIIQRRRSCCWISACWHHQWLAPPLSCNQAQQCLRKRRHGGGAAETKAASRFADEALSLLDPSPVASSSLLRLCVAAPACGEHSAFLFDNFDINYVLTLMSQFCF